MAWLCYRYLYRKVVYFPPPLPISSNSTEELPLLFGAFLFGGEILHITITPKCEFNSEKKVQKFTKSQPVNTIVDSGDFVLITNNGKDNFKLISYRRKFSHSVVQHEG
jgi:hypothetical protein